MVDHEPVVIPSNNAFLCKWHSWIYKKVSSRFKRNQDRIPDVAQDVRCRLLSKDFIGRWFFKHLTDDLLDKREAAYILGIEEENLRFISSIPTFEGMKRGNPRVMWRLSDILEYAKFDYERYYYSVQGHTIGSDRVLRLLGYEPGKYNSLASLYRQNRLLPSEFTDHDCTGDRKTCEFCVKGRASLYKRDLSLIHDWESPDSALSASKLRWNDKQLIPFLRCWRRKNRIKSVPRYIMRPAGDPGIDAGLLKYADTIIQNSVNNQFLRMGRHDDIEFSVLNGGKSPPFSNAETIAWEIDDQAETAPQRVYRDLMSSTLFSEFERRYDTSSILDRADLTEEELGVFEAVEMMEITARQYAKDNHISPSRVTRLYSSAKGKVRRIIDWDQEDLDFHNQIDQ